MRYLVRLGGEGEHDDDEPPAGVRPPWVTVSDPYVDLVYGPLVGAMALLVLRYLHAAATAGSEPTCTLEELALATASKPRRMRGPLRRLARHRLIVLRDPRLHDHDGTVLPEREMLGAILLPVRLPLASAAAINRLPPLATVIARARLPN